MRATARGLRRRPSTTPSWSRPTVVPGSPTWTRRPASVDNFRDGPVDVGDLPLRRVDIHVPPNCVARDTVVHVTHRPARGAVAPLPVFSIHFDGGLQPQVPVEVQVETSVDLRGRRVVLVCERGGGRDEETDEVYFKVDNPLVLRADIPHFSDYRFEVGAEQCTLSFTRNENFDRGYNDWDDAKNRYTRGGMPYYLPFGFSRSAVRQTCFGDKDMGEFEDAAVGFHGTTLQSAAGILKGGFRINPPRPGHIPEGYAMFGVSNWAKAIFLSPSYKYCMFYGNAGEATPVRGYADGLYIATGSWEGGQVVYCLLQCRVKKDALTVRPGTRDKVFPGTTGCFNDSDSRVPASEMEYHVRDPSQIAVYGLLIRRVPVAEVKNVSKSSWR